jgi:acetyl-CoA carboxylase biotin carboxyl carrier protein
MIDIRKLKELVRLMVENELSELDLQDQQETVKIRRGPEQQTVVNHQPVIYNGSGSPGYGSAPAPAPAQPAGDGADPAPSPDDAGLVPIESPMVGTFYTAPNPDSEAYVSVGSEISEDTNVCLVEAMKVFNEIKAGVSGRIERILVKSGEAVEFGQPLFLVRPA